MPRRSKGPRLYLDPERKKWTIRDGSLRIRTGCGERDRAKAEKYLAQYIGEKHDPEPSSAPMIADVLSVYGDEVAAHRSTARNLGYVIGKVLAGWGDKRTSDITTASCREYAKSRGNASAALSDIKTLHAAVLYWHNHEKFGPLAVMPKFWRPEAGPPRERYLTRSEAARILKAAKPYQHIRRLILLGLYTGSRPGILLALKWSQVDLNAGILIRTTGPQVHNKKAPRVRLGRRILAHLKRWKKIDRGIDLVCYFREHPHLAPRQVIDPHGTWRRVVKAAGLTGVTRHTLRHTRATWMAQKGVPLFEAAGFLGMTVKTLERVYAHHDPAHQEHAANI